MKCVKQRVLVVDGLASPRWESLESFLSGLSAEQDFQPVDALNGMSWCFKLRGLASVEPAMSKEEADQHADNGYHAVYEDGPYFILRCRRAVPFRVTVDKGYLDA